MLLLNTCKRGRKGGGERGGERGREGESGGEREKERERERGGRREREGEREGYVKVKQKGNVKYLGISREVRQGGVHTTYHALLT